MKSLRIQNLRSLKDTEEIVIKPLNVLVGRNSSGKSTFLRFFPLIKQTLETKINEPVLWYSPSNVDFGSFRESLNKNLNPDSTISFTFKFDVNLNNLVGNLAIDGVFFFGENRENYRKERIQECDVKIVLSEKIINRVEIICANQKIVFNQSHDNLNTVSYEKLIRNPISITINNSEIKNVFNSSQTYSSGILPRVFVKSGNEDNTFEPLSNFFRNEFYSYIENNLKKFSNEELASTNVDTSFGDKQHIKQSLILTKGISEDLRSILNQLDEDDEEFNTLNNILVGYHIEELINIINDNIRSYFLSVNYVAPLRARAERYYRIKGLSIDEVDPEGENIPSMLQNMPQSEKVDFEDWLKSNFGFVIKSDGSEGGHSSLQFRMNNDSTINMADTGFGYSQILPILIILWRGTKSRREMYLNYRITKKRKRFYNIIIEQPELHLHPALQAKVVDSFINIIALSKKNNIDLNIFIETHSETIINRIGYHLAKNTYKKFSSEDVNVMIFENSKDPYETEVIKAKYNPNGVLKNWPFGFFDPEV